MKSFLHGKKTLSVEPLQALSAVAPAVQPAAGPTAKSAARPASAGGEDRPNPTVEVVKEGDKVVRLVVVCSCGERVEIECLYPAG